MQIHITTAMLIIILSRIIYGGMVSILKTVDSENYMT